MGASAVVDGCTTVGDETEIYPFASIGLPPQDLKYRGEATRLIIGKRNIFREFVNSLDPDDPRGGPGSGGGSSG